jgi:NADPH:quinone reductase-like Zn-dependent oxidoreductase
MLAAILPNHDEPLTLDSSKEKPVPLANDVLIKVYAAGVNPVDYKFARGDLKMVFSLTFPAILGMDFSGVIEAIGSNVTQFNVGDAVFGNITSGEMSKRCGSYAE